MKPISKPMILILSPISILHGRISHINGELQLVENNKLPVLPFLGGILLQGDSAIFLLFFELFGSEGGDSLGCGCIGRQFEPDLAAFSEHRVNFQSTVMIIDDFLTDQQSKTVAGFLGSEPLAESLIK